MSNFVSIKCYFANIEVINNEMYSNGGLSIFTSNKKILSKFVVIGYN